MDTLKSIHLFQGLSEATIAALEKRSITRYYPKKTTLFAEGDRPNGLYCLIEGRVEVLLKDEEDKAFIIKTLGPGDYFGELGLLDKDVSRTAMVCTTTPCTITLLKRHHFAQLLEEQPELNQVLITNLVGMVKSLTDQVKSLALKDVYGRLRQLLIEHCAQTQVGEPVLHKITQQGIALRIGASREMVARILKELKLGGYITMEKKYIRLLKTLPEHF